MGVENLELISFLCVFCVLLEVVDGMGELCKIFSSAFIHQNVTLMNSLFNLSLVCLAGIFFKYEKTAGGQEITHFLIVCGPVYNDCHFALVTMCDNCIV
jgi:hypothetical protein